MTLAEIWGAASWSMVKLTDPGAGVPVTVAAAAEEDDVAVAMAATSEGFVRALAAVCRAESFVRTACQAPTLLW